MSEREIKDEPSRSRLLRAQQVAAGWFVSKAGNEHLDVEALCGTSMKDATSLSSLKNCHANAMEYGVVRDSSKK